MPPDCSAGEELEVAKPHLHGLLHQAGVVDPGDDGDVLVQAVLHRGRVEAGADDEVSTRRNGRIHLLAVEHGAGPDQQIRVGRAHLADGLCGGGGDVGPLQACGEITGAEGVARRRGVDHLFGGQPQGGDFDPLRCRDHQATSEPRLTTISPTPKPWLPGCIASATPTGASSTSISTTRPSPAGATITTRSSRP